MKRSFQVGAIGWVDLRQGREHLCLGTLHSPSVWNEEDMEGRRSNQDVWEGDGRPVRP